MKFKFRKHSCFCACSKRPSNPNDTFIMFSDRPTFRRRFDSKFLLCTYVISCERYSRMQTSSCIKGKKIQSLPYSIWRVFFLLYTHSKYNILNVHRYYWVISERIAKLLTPPNKYSHVFGAFSTQFILFFHVSPIDISFDHWINIITHMCGCEIKKTRVCRWWLLNDVVFMNEVVLAWAGDRPDRIQHATT